MISSLVCFGICSENFSDVDYLTIEKCYIMYFFKTLWYVIS